MSNATLWPTVCEETNGKCVPAGTHFFVVSVNPKENLERVVNYYDLHQPWLVLLEDKVRLVDILNRQLMDITPFVDENGHPWYYDYFLEAK